MQILNMTRKNMLWVPENQIDKIIKECNEIDNSIILTQLLKRN